jgi:hypothetical protein
MERWGVPDARALELIDFPGQPGKSGKRPRFRFTTHQQRITSFLPEIEAALRAAGKDPAWLHRAQRAAPFRGRTPLDHMIHDGLEGFADVLRALNRAVLRAALAG